MSSQENIDIEYLPLSNENSKHYMNDRTDLSLDLKYTSGNKQRKSLSRDNPNSNTLDLRITKDQNTAPEIEENKSKIPRHLRKTISSGGISPVSSSKVVLRRWTSVIQDDEKSLKRHSASSILERSKEEKVVFRPVSSILVSTPWAKYFKGNSSKGAKEPEEKADEKEKSEEKVQTRKAEFATSDSCLAEKFEQSRDPRTGSLVGKGGWHSTVGKSKTQQNLFNLSGQPSCSIGFNANKHEKNGEIEVSSLPRAKQINGDICLEEKANYVLYNGTATPQVKDNYFQTTKLPSKQNTQEVSKVIETGNEYDSPDNTAEEGEMSLSSGSYFYKSKYSSDFAANEPSYRRGNSSSYGRRTGISVDRSYPSTRAADLTYTSAFKISRAANIEKSGKETVAEVEAFISAYKSRRERSFEYGETGYQSNFSRRSERKSSLEKAPPTYQSHATRSLTSSYTPTYLSNTPPASSILDGGKQRQSYLTSAERDKSAHYLAKSIRSKSFDTDSVPYSSFTRTGSGGRYPRRTISSTNSSTSSSRGYSPPEKELDDSPFSPGKPSTPSQISGSILSSDILTPSEKAFFSGSSISYISSTNSNGNYRKSFDFSTSDSSSYRRNSIGHSNLKTSGDLKSDSKAKRPLSLVSSDRRFSVPSGDALKRKSAVLGEQNDSSSRSRIMGGILSRFFAEELPEKVEGTPCAETNTNQDTTEKPFLTSCHSQENVDLNVQSNHSGEDVSHQTQVACSEKNLQQSQHNGDSQTVVQSSPSPERPEDSNQTPSSKNRQLVRVKSTYVDEVEPASMGKDKPSHKSKGKPVDGAEKQVSKEGKDGEQTPHHRERRSSWLGRSLRKISSSGSRNTVPEEPQVQESSEKPKRERRRSLLWRLGRESRTSESLDEKAASKQAAQVSSENKTTEKKEKSEEKKEEKGFASYLRRSSKRKKSQVSEKEILEARQEVHGTSREGKESRGGKESTQPEILDTAAQVSQSDVTVHSSDEVSKESVSVEQGRPDATPRAPLAQAEDSEDEMAYASARRTRFAEVLRQKEEEAREATTVARTGTVTTSKTAETTKPLSGPEQAASKQKSSYLSSKFMKSKHLFEASSGKPSSDLKKSTGPSKPVTRRWTQDAKVEPRVRKAGTKEFTSNDESKSGDSSRAIPSISEKRALFQKSRTFDSDESSKKDLPGSGDKRLPLKERNKISGGPGTVSKQKETTGRGATTDLSTKSPVRRLASDSVLKFKTREKKRSKEQGTTHGKKVEETTQIDKRLNREDKESVVTTARDSRQTDPMKEIIIEKGMPKSDSSDILNKSNEKDNDTLESNRKEDNLISRQTENELSLGIAQDKPRKSTDILVATETETSGRVPLRMRIVQSQPRTDVSSGVEDVGESEKSRAEKQKEVLEEKEEASNIEIQNQGESAISDADVVTPDVEAKDICLEKPLAVNGTVDTLQVNDKLDGDNEEKDNTTERAGSRRRRERRSHRLRQVDPKELEKAKEQVRRESSVRAEDVADINESATLSEDVKGLKITSDAVEEKPPSVINEPVVSNIEAEKKSESLDEKVVVNHTDIVPETTLEIPSKDTIQNANVVELKIGAKTNDVDTGDESYESSSSGSLTKLTTRSVIKEKIKQKKIDKRLRKDRTMSLPLGVEIVVTPQNKVKQDIEIVVNGTRSPLLRSKPPIPKIQRSQEADDISSLQKRTKRPIRSRPKTLTQGIDPGLLLSDIKAKEEAVVVEEKLSIAQLKERLLQSESGSKTPKTPEVQRKAKRRSGKRYKTITEGIAPGLLEAAHQLASAEQDPNKLGVDQTRLNLALSASTENLKRRSFIVSEVNSRVGSIGASLATSMEDLSMKDNEHEKDSKSSESIVEESIRKLKKLPMVVDSDEDEPLPSVSSLKQKFMQAVEDSYKPSKNKVSMRKKGIRKDRPFTISGIDDLTFKQLQSDIKQRHEAAYEKTLSEVEIRIEVENKKNEHFDELAEDQLEIMLASEGLTADQVALELGINPSLAQGSPLRSRKPFLGTTTEETASDMLEVIDEKAEKPEKEDKEKPLGLLRKEFMSAMSEFKSGSFDKGADSVEETIKEREEPAEPKSDMDWISQSVTQLQSVSDRRHLKPQRKKRSPANPVKTLQARSDLITEVGSNNKSENVQQDSQKSSEKSAGLKLWRKVALANEAKAALQSTEDFSKVKLKKVKIPGQSMNGEPPETGGVVECNVTNLLLKIKGRRHVQINVVDFNTDSLTSDDSFVVVTPKELFCWHGRNANVIEKAKAAEIASRINQKKEMGCKALDVVYFEQDGQNESRVFRVLGSEGRTNIKDETDDDEEYERSMMNTSMAYSLQDSDPPELVPVYDMCQRSPSKEILRTDEAYVFDFLTEVYVWIGRQTMSNVRKKIMKLAREKFEQGYYKPISASTPHHHGKSRKISLTATELPTRKQSINRKLSVHKFLQDKENLVPRPHHSIFLSMYEGAEWVIFKEKFCDWPDESRIIRMKGGPQTVGVLAKSVNVADVKPVDPKTMLDPKCVPILPVFEGTEIDRGCGKPKGQEGYHIITRHVQVWHVTERFRTLLPETSNGHFHSGEGYVIRWEYSIVASRVMKMLKDIEEAKATGRHRCAYFFWLGNDCSVTEQGATAVMTVDLDEERGPHVRVIQGKEPPCFLNIFDGGMIIHAGKRKSKTDKVTFSDRSTVRFYCVRNENPNEACLLQVPVSATSLRSRSSFVLVLCQQAEIFLWHGCKSSDATRATALNAVHRLIENHPEEALLSEKEEIFLTEVEEGHEPEVFWVAVGGEDDYGSLLTDLNNKWDFVPRCFHLTSTSGQFVASEIINPSIDPKEKCPFPFLQDDLYDSSQPGIFIIDAIHELYLWLGWWPEEEDSENSDAQRMRWDVDKRKAIESVVLYAQEVGRPLSHCYVVDAGLEPEQFTHLFPYWIVQEDITEIQIEDGREDSDKLQLISKKLEGFTREYFSIEELIQRPLPEGVNPSRLESYLSDEDFYSVFQMDRDEFKKMPGWRKDNMKKNVGLY